MKLLFYNVILFLVGPSEVPAVGRTSLAGGGGGVPMVRDEASEHVAATGPVAASLVGVCGSGPGVVATGGG